MTSTTTTTITTTTVASPVGPLTLVANDHALIGLEMEGQRHSRDYAARAVDGPLDAVATQLDEYFAGERRSFDVSLELHGTEFQRSVWNALLEIPYGETMSYGELAAQIGTPNASRAVGLANGRNPIAIIVPCHRVIGANGSMTGYGGGIERKVWLLEHERGAARLAL